MMYGGSGSKSEDENTWIPDVFPVPLDPPPKRETDSAKLRKQYKRGNPRKPTEKPKT